MYLHEPGEEADSYTKEEMAMGKHHAKIHPLQGPQNTGAHVINDQGLAVGPPAPFGPNAPAHHQDSKSEAEPVPPAKVSLDYVSYFL
jgi:hypothetical protein